MMDMLTIIDPVAREDGGHGLQSQSGRTECWEEGWIALPEDVAIKAWETRGYGDLVYDDEGNPIDWIPGEVPPPPEPQPSEQELRMKALEDENKMLSNALAEMAAVIYSE